LMMRVMREMSMEIPPNGALTWPSNDVPAPNGITGTPCRAQRATIALTSAVDWVWVEGNHDPKPPEDLGGRAARELRLGPLLFRHEPTIGEINYPYLFDLLDELGYRGWVGCEYRPEGDTWAGLSWAAKYGILGSRSTPVK